MLGVLGVFGMVTTLMLLVLFVIAVKLFGRAEKELPSRPPQNHDVAPEPMSDEEYFLVQRGQGEVYDSYYRLCYVIQNSKSTAKRLAACEESYEILPAFVRVNLRDFGSLPDSIPCRDYGVEMYMRQGEWAKARSAIEKCAAAGAYDDDGQEMCQKLHA